MLSKRSFLLLAAAFLISLIFFSSFNLRFADLSFRASASFSIRANLSASALIFLNCAMPSALPGQSELQMLSAYCVLIRQAYDRSRLPVLVDALIAAIALGAFSI